jgi:hypothetical protein
MKNKLFFFGDWERVHQSFLSPVLMSFPFTPDDGTVNEPFNENEYDGRVDWQATSKVKLFYKFTFDSLQNTRTQSGFAAFANVNETPSHVVGADFNTGNYTHSIRFGYTKMRNNITDAVLGSSIYSPGGDVGISISSGAFRTGPSYLAPQATIQENRQIKYDGSRIKGSHIFRYGFGYNRIGAISYAALGGAGPVAESTAGNVCGPPAFTSCPGTPGDASNPLNYLVTQIVVGNNQGASTEIPGFGYPAGAQVPDNRILAYFGDSWKVSKNLMLTYGLRYVRDTGRNNADLAPVPCPTMDAAVSQSLAAAGNPCTGNILDLWQPGLANRVNQPNRNFGPTLGLAWDPTGTGKTVFRVGTGIYYETALLTNVLNIRPAYLPRGLFQETLNACPSGLPLPTGTVISTTNICGQPIGNVLPQIAALQTELERATVQAGPQANGVFVGNTLNVGDADGAGYRILAPDFRPAYSWQLNAGVERQLWKGTVLSADYLRNVNLHYLLSYDLNHVGDARYFNKNAANNAIATTLSNCGVGTINQAIQNCPNNPVTGAPNYNLPATFVDFATNGLDSGNQFLGGAPALVIGDTPNTGAAFPGINPNLGQLEVLYPVGRSVYNALQLSLRSQVDHPLQGVKALNLQISYALSRFISITNDQDSGYNNAPNFNNTNQYIGPSSLDRRHQFSAGGWFDLPAALRMGFITHFYSALPVTVQLPSPQNSAGFIFTSDLDGDGSGAGDTTGGSGDILPGTNIGSFDRNFGAGGINKVLTNYSNTAGGQLTPAGQKLVQSGLFTPTQLLELCAYTPSLSQPAVVANNPALSASCAAVNPQLQLAPAGQANVSSLFTFDLSLSWLLKPSKVWKGVPEALTIEPQATIFNILNRQNYDSYGNLMSGVLNSSGSINSTTLSGPLKRTNLLGLGSGVFALGAPRQIELGLKVSF